MSPSFGRCRSLSALVLVLATASPLAAAAPVLLRQASQIAVLAPTDATARTYRPGETVFDEPLLWSGGATLAHGVSVTVHGRSATIAPGESLPAARLRIDGGGPADRVRVMYRGLGFGTTEPMFELEIIQQGRKRVFDSMSTESGTGMPTAKRFTFVSSKHGWPADVNLLGLRFAVTGLDPASKGVTIAWPAEDGAPRQLVVSDDVQYVMRPY